MNQHMRPHMWYFTMEDCQDKLVTHLRNYLGNDFPTETIKFEWEFKATQPNSSEFSYELFGSMKVAVFQVACYACVFITMAVYQLQEARRSGHVHFMIQILNACVMIQFSSALFYLFHLIIYSFNGLGVPFAEATSEALAMISQVVVSCVLFLIALGYSLNVPASTSPVDVKAVGIPVSAVIATIHILLVRQLRHKKKLLRLSANVSPKWCLDSW